MNFDMKGWPLTSCKIIRSCHTWIICFSWITNLKVVVNKDVTCVELAVKVKYGVLTSCLSQNLQRKHLFLISFVLWICQLHKTDTGEGPFIFE